MLVEDIFNMTGLGTVLTGKVLSGSISTGDQALCKTPSREIKVRVAQLLDTNSRSIKKAEAGSTVGVVCKEIDLSSFSDCMQVEGDHNRVVGVTLVFAPKKSWWG